MKALVSLYLVFVLASIGFFLYTIPLWISGTITVLCTLGLIAMWYIARRWRLHA